MEPRLLEVEGHAGRPLPCVLYETGAGRVAVVLPGDSRAGNRLGGTPARPDLNYTRALLTESGFDVLEAWWDAEKRPRGSDEWYRNNALAALRAAGEERVRLLVGRSIGTIGLSVLRDRSELPSIWIAPLTYLDFVREALEAWRGPALVVAADADETWQPVSGERIEVVTIPGGDHGLNVGDAAASARALADALDRMRAWLEHTCPPESGPGTVP